MSVFAVLLFFVGCILPDEVGFGASRSEGRSSTIATSTRGTITEVDYGDEVESLSSSSTSHSSGGDKWTFSGWVVYYIDKQKVRDHFVEQPTIDIEGMESRIIEEIRKGHEEKAAADKKKEGESAEQVESWIHIFEDHPWIWGVIGGAILVIIIFNKKIVAFILSLRGKVPPWIGGTKKKEGEE